MQLKARLRQTGRAVNSAAGTPSKMRRGFFPRRKARQTPFRGSNRARDCTKWRSLQHLSRGYSFAGRPPQSSANKQQRLGIYESKKLRDEFGRQSPVGKSRNSHGNLNRLDKWAASAFTPKVSVAQCPPRIK